MKRRRSRPSMSNGAGQKWRSQRRMRTRAGNRGDAARGAGEGDVSDSWAGEEGRGGGGDGADMGRSIHSRQARPLPHRTPSTCHAACSPPFCRGLTRHAPSGCTPAMAGWASSDPPLCSKLPSPRRQTAAQGRKNMIYTACTSISMQFTSPWFLAHQCQETGFRGPGRTSACQHRYG
jgi:hypothetical protein